MPIVFSKPAFAALVACAAKPPAFVDLTQIAIWEDGSAGATNGYRMIMCRPADGDAWTHDRGRPTLVSREAAQRALKLMKAKDNVEVHDGGVLRVNEADVPFAATSETFPPLHEAAKESESQPENPIGVDASLLADTLSHLAKVLKPRKIPKVRITTSAALDPIRIECEDLETETDWLAVVMPCRI